MTDPAPELQLLEVLQLESAVGSRPRAMMATMSDYGTTGGPFPGDYDADQPTDEASPWHEEVSVAAPAVAQAVNHDTALVTPNNVPGAVLKVLYTPTTTITGADTDTRTVQLLNGATVVATYTFSAGHDAPSGAAKEIPITGPTGIGPAAALTWRSTHVGAGLADPGGTVVVHVADRNSAAES